MGNTPTVRPLFLSYSTSIQHATQWLIHEYYTPCHNLLLSFLVHHSRSPPHLLIYNSTPKIRKIQHISPAYFHNIQVFIWPYSSNFLLLFQALSTTCWLATNHLFRAFCTKKRPLPFPHLSNKGSTKEQTYLFPHFPTKEVQPRKKIGLFLCSSFVGKGAEKLWVVSLCLLCWKKCGKSVQ